MKFGLAIFLCIVLAISSEWVYRSFFRPVIQPTQNMQSLASYFKSVGIDGYLYPVRHGFKRSQVTASAGYKINKFPFPIAIEESPDIDAAILHFSKIENSPNLMHPQRNGVMVLNLPMWGEDTDEMANKVIKAFHEFSY